MPRALDYSHWKSVAVDFVDRGRDANVAKLLTNGETVVFSFLPFHFFQSTKHYFMNCLSSTETGPGWFRGTCSQIFLATGQQLDAICYRNRWMNSGDGRFLSAPGSNRGSSARTDATARSTDGPNSRVIVDVSTHWNEACGERPCTVEPSVDGMRYYTGAR